MGETPEEHQTDDGLKLDSTGEFFSVGTPLHAVRAGYIRRRADDLLYEAAIAGRHAHIIAPDRSGKSSLIAATAARLEANGVQVAILDLEQIGIRQGEHDAGRWYYSVAYRLMRQLRIRFDLQTWWQDKSVLSNRQRLLEFYSEIVLANVPQPIAIFVDEVQCIGRLPFGDQLLASIRAAHNARTTDPDFMRLTFVLLGECDPLSLLNEPELSPFNVTQEIPLDDFAREDLNLFVSELGLDGERAKRALDRIYHWTRGQPYLTQKLARAVSRESPGDAVEDAVDRIVQQQLAGRAALHSEPHMSHIHREIVASGCDSEKLLNLYGKLCMGIDVPADLGSVEQRRLMAVGLLEVDDSGELRIRNRIYAAVFTARWANENIPTRWRTLAIAAAVLIVVAFVPFWYTQWLPRPYVDVMTSAASELPVAETAWRNLRSFPGHTATADRVYRNYLAQRARVADTEADIAAVVERATALPGAGQMPGELLAGFWDRRADAAIRMEERDAALLASLEALVVSTPRRRNRSAMLVGDDYPLLLASTPPGAAQDLVFNPGSLLLTAARGPRVQQWSLGPDGLAANAPWLITALDVTPLVRRVVVDRGGSVSRIGLVLNISHPRMSDLRIKLIAPSGRAVEVDTGRERASSSDDLRIPAAQFAPLIGESLSGTWSISLRDEATGVAGHLVGWNLSLNSQALIEDFQRGIGIPDPVERETEQFWVSSEGRYAVARAQLSDSARLWDLAFAKPVAAIAVSEREQLIGVDEGARRLVTATLDTVHIWDTATGKRSASLPVGAGSAASSLTDDGRHLFAQYRGDVETRLELWNIETGARTSELVVAGSPALVALDATGGRIAIADYDRAVRIWDFENGDMLRQLDLPLQPSVLRLNATGEVLATVYGRSGFAVWKIAEPGAPMLETFGDGGWEVDFSASGARFVAGGAHVGFRLHESADGRLLGPALGAGGGPAGSSLLGLGRNEDVVVTGGPGGMVRFWQLPVSSSPALAAADEHVVWHPAGDSIVAVLPDASKIAVGDRDGHVHLLPSDALSGAIAAQSEDVSFLGHNDVVRRLIATGDGEMLASVAADNSVRVWNTDSGEPLPFITEVPGAGVARIAFSRDGNLLGLIGGNHVSVMNVASGKLEAGLELAVGLQSLAFAENSRLYLGSDDGSISVMSRDSGGNWALSRMWQGDAPIRQLESSPNGDFLVVADDTGLARQFSLAEDRPGGLSIRLPGPVEDVVFSPGGSRVLLRTARWIHRAASSGNGLTWLDGVQVPPVLNGARIVFGDSPVRDAGVGNAFHIAVARDGGPTLVNLRFAATEPPGLFGNYAELISEWRERLGLAASEAGAASAVAGEAATGNSGDLREVQPR